VTTEDESPAPQKSLYIEWAMVDGSTAVTMHTGSADEIDEIMAGLADVLAGNSVLGAEHYGSIRLINGRNALYADVTVKDVAP
jgi:hypothetical protein